MREKNGRITKIREKDQKIWEKNIRMERLTVSESEIAEEREMLDRKRWMREKIKIIKKRMWERKKVKK